MKRLLLLASCTLVLAACSDSSTAPQSGRAAKGHARFDDEFTCKSGYVTAFDEDGNPYCIPDPNNPPEANGGGNGPAGQSSSTSGPLGPSKPQP